MADPLRKLLKNDTRYDREAYIFVRHALAYAQQVLNMGGKSDEEDPHLTGQQLCEAIRVFALDQFGLMAKVVLNSWGVHTTSDFGEMVYNLIEIGEMRKSKSDRKKDFDDVYDFEVAFRQEFRITVDEDDSD